MTWTDRVPDREAHARAGGRARYNRDRKLRAALRCSLVVRRYIELDAAPGAKAQIAREWGLHRSTITRDIQRWCGDTDWWCPTCTRPLSNDEWKVLARVRAEHHVPDPRTDESQARMTAIRAIRAELPRVLAELDIFVADGPAPGGGDRDVTHDDGPRLVVEDFVNDLASRVDDRHRSVA